MIGIRTPLRAGMLAVAAVVVVGAPAAGAQPLTWNFQQADVPTAQAPGADGRGVLVAVVDTWVDPTQPQFGGRVVDEADCLPGSCQDHSYAPDSCVHGTHVAGTIASADYGVAPAAEILAVQVLSGPPGSPDPSAGCSGSTSTVAAGIDFAVSKGAKVINLSVGDEVPGLFQSAAISNAVTNAAQQGVVVVFAAGNQGVPLTDSYGNDALLVAATGPSGQLAGYSNFNTALTGAVSVAAPGGDSGNGSCSTSTCVLSTFPGRSLGLLEGTSMAAPHVSGLAALLLAQDPGRGLKGVFSAIESTAKPLAGAGSGLIDAGKALRAETVSHAVSASTTPTTTPSRSGRTATTGAVPRGLSGMTNQSTPLLNASPAPPTQQATSSRASPGTTTTARPALAAPEGAEQPNAAMPLSPKQENRPQNSSWLGRNATILIIACLMLAGDLILILYRQRNAMYPMRRRPR